jgi:hypothetical protein
MDFPPNALFLAEIYHKHPKNGRTPHIIRRNKWFAASAYAGFCEILHKKESLFLDAAPRILSCIRLWGIV